LIEDNFAEMVTSFAQKRFYGHEEHVNRIQNS